MCIINFPQEQSSAMYTLQRRVRVLREQVQRRDLHLELLRRKLALLEDGARGKCIVQVNSSSFAIITRNIFIFKITFFRTKEMKHYVEHGEPVSMQSEHVNN